MASIESSSRDRRKTKSQKVKASRSLLGVVSKAKEVENYYA